jgi:hypothetical protein
VSSRRSFTKLSRSYRYRLIYQEAGGKRAYDSMTTEDRRDVRARAAATHRSGNLIRARGHQPSRPAGAVPEKVIEPILRGEGSPADLKTLAKKFVRPSWVPSWAAVDVAAALSQLPNPRRWKSVDFIPRGEGEPWTMIVHLKGNAYDREILIPGGGGPGSGAKEVLRIVTELGEGSPAPTSHPETAAARRQLEIEEVFFEVWGSDENEA